MADVEKKTFAGAHKMFGPLTFEDPAKSNAELYNLETKCPLCEDSFNLNVCLDTFLKHIFVNHQLVIEEVQFIHNLNEYLTYWREKFKQTSMEECVPSIKVEGADANQYFLLSSLLEEDKKLRHQLKLEHNLKIQDFERTDVNYVRSCLFCKLIFEGTRHDFLNHLSTRHNLQLGNPQNLVHIEELVDKIDLKLKKLNCIYCYKTFPERSVLKEHMRKKIHKRINPEHTEYDKFYIVNYLEIDKSWQAIEKEDDRYAINANDDEEYFDWNEKNDNRTITCLFCKKKESNINVVCLHLEADHNFDFVEATKNFDFYQKVKLVNFIRKRIHDKFCVFCDEQFDNWERLSRHLYDKKHCRIPIDKNTYDQPEFYFPTYEDDAFLYYIEDVED